MAAFAGQPIVQIFLLLTLFQIKHFICDFPLQRPFMLKGKVLPGWDFAAPLAIHCSVHAVATLLIVLWVNPALWYLALIDFLGHFVMDRIKAGPNYLGRWSDRQDPRYWYSLGFDQMVHHLVNLYIVYCLVA